MSIGLRKRELIKQKPQTDYDPHEHLFRSFINGLFVLADNNCQVLTKIDLDIVERKLQDTNVDLYYVKDWFRRGYKPDILNFSNLDDPVVSYVRRCIGHKINYKIFFRYPRLSVLYSLRILKGRWPLAEEAISSDDVASYLYAKYVICGRLPEKMHTEIVMRTFVDTTVAARSYFLEI